MEIIKTTLLTNKLEETYLFYKDLLDFDILEKKASLFSIQCGASILEFVEVNQADNPFYHFAFDIPSNSIQEAKIWLKKRVTLLKEEGKDEISFEGFDSTSIYFEDPSGNIVEFIERKFNPESEEDFSSDSIQRISEMSLVVDDKLKTADFLEEIGIYSLGHAKIKESGLSFMTDNQTNVFLLLVNEKRTWLFSEKQSSVFEQIIELESGHCIGIDQNGEFFSQ